MKDELETGDGNDDDDHDDGDDDERVTGTESRAGWTGWRR